MIELKPVGIFVLVIAALVAMALGDYLGYKFRAVRVALYLGFIALAVIVLFAIYAGIVLSRG